MKNRVSLRDVVSKVPETNFVGNPDAFIAQPLNFDEFNKDPDVIMWANAKTLERVKELKFGTIVCTEIPAEYQVETCNYIFTPQPRKIFATLMRTFFIEKQTPRISEKASIHPSATIGENCTIDDFCVIEKNVTIGDNCVIGSNSVILKDSVIGTDVVIGCNCTIGGVGFGYEKDDDGDYVLLPHLGNVVLKNKVEIGNNTTIDRAVMGSTILYENVKVDNLVHIAHGVQIGKNSLIIANAMVAGSTMIGENVWVAPSSSLLNKITIEDNSVIGMGAVVLKSVRAGEVIVGNPGKRL